MCSCIDGWFCNKCTQSGFFFQYKVALYKGMAVMPGHSTNCGHFGWDFGRKDDLLNSF